MTLTIHNVPEDLDREVRRCAAAAGQTVEAFVLHVLRRAVGLPPAGEAVTGDRAIGTKVEPEDRK